MLKNHLLCCHYTPDCPRLSLQSSQVSTTIQSWMSIYLATQTNTTIGNSSLAGAGFKYVSGRKWNVRLKSRNTSLRCRSKRSCCCQGIHGDYYERFHSEQSEYTISKSKYSTIFIISMMWETGQQLVPSSFVFFLWSGRTNGIFHKQEYFESSSNGQTIMQCR